ncbi:Protein of uncharacterised function DUF86 [Campylobacter hyointestinalis subsp. hyointestinalis]|uniref:Protein of uncharacterized function DUF86 n=1 Tax=Campylobacter hyointestinalis subsp. hyointestinalis TaxID=91352 RepID=A0A9W5AUR8_CAMHY|nr:HepT-like ribonuclease domain-containing protein [Campylobacter hyointestinalis]CUU72524.1 Protein of uncharacterised function DUF86 [Campylobacter hyointestinalis subsp. hyointestinalis]CUU72526.1 Protein of uncharacterised function DUF86 [Campylobacter hyointestinalis subsp. hyointestinalis]CUU84498.1 Protein of uncharacterised function DUF86 [Campylobacter hyointestinalis subsp. hyointestinalis]
MSSHVRRLETAVEKIEEIEKICNLKGVTKALEDESILKPAIMKHFDVIYQQFEKLEKDQEYQILGKFDKEELKGLRRVRNWSSHDYDNIQNEIIEETIHKDLPKLKENIQKVLKETKKEMCEDLQKKIDRFVKKQDILMPDARSELAKDIKQNYEKLQEHKIELDKPYSDKIKNIIKDNSKENQK